MSYLYLIASLILVVLVGRIVRPRPKNTEPQLQASLYSKLDPKTGQVEPLTRQQIRDL